MTFNFLKMKSHGASVALAIMGAVALSACSSLEDTCAFAGAVQVNGQDIAAVIDVCEPEPMEPSPDADPEEEPWM